MGKKKHQKIDTNGGDDAFGANPFSGLSSSGLPKGSVKPEAIKKENRKSLKGGRLDVKREKSGRGGKTVTVIYPFPGMGEAMKKDILSLLKKKLATGGTISNGNVEIQGDFADRTVEVLSSDGYRPVRSGG